MVMARLGLILAAQGSISSALLPYLGFLSPISSSALPVLPARTTSVVPTFPHTCSLTVVILLQPPHLHTFSSAPCFSGALPGTPDRNGPIDPGVSLTTSRAAVQPFITTPHPFTLQGPSSSLAAVTPPGSFPLFSGRSRHLPTPHISLAAPPLSPSPVTAIPSHTPPADSPHLTSAPALPSSRAPPVYPHPPGPPWPASLPPFPVPSS